MMFEKKEKRFHVKEGENDGGSGTIRVIVDTKTGVHYIMTAGVGGSAITPLLDGNGKVVVDHFLSSRCKTTVASLVSGLVFCIALGALSAWLCSILPASGAGIQASILYAITDFQFLSLGGLAVWTPCAMIGACTIEIPLFGFLAVRSYCGHTVN